MVVGGQKRKNPIKSVACGPVIAGVGADTEMLGVAEGETAGEKVVGKYSIKIFKLAVAKCPGNPFLLRSPMSTSLRCCVKYTLHY